MICFPDRGNPYVGAAIARAMRPYRPKTAQMYRKQFHLFLCYSIKAGASTVLSVQNYISFLEFLLQCNISPRSISNYASAIKSYLKLYQQPVEWLENSMIGNYLRALHIQVPHVRVQSMLTGNCVDVMYS